jgi:hypothetical protein
MTYTNTKRHQMETFHTDFHPNRSPNMEVTSINPLTLVSRQYDCHTTCFLKAHYSSTNVCTQLLYRISCNPNNDSVADTMSSGVPRLFLSRGGSTNSVEGKGQRERGSMGGSPLVRGSTQFANE